MSSMRSNSRESTCFKQSSRVRMHVISPPPAARLHAAVNYATAASHTSTSMKLCLALGRQWPPLVQVLASLGDAERYVSRQAQTRILTFRGNSSVAQRAAGIQASKQLSLILTRYCTYAPLSRVPASAYHSWYLAVATALSPRMAVSLPLMQINRQ